jgi:hypothetical protein
MPHIYLQKKKSFLRDSILLMNNITFLSCLLGNCTFLAPKHTVMEDQSEIKEKLENNPLYQKTTYISRRHGMGLEIYVA